MSRRTLRLCTGVLAEVADLEGRSVLDVILYEPEIPPNTGNIMRLCANVGAGLHLIEPLGFQLDDRQLKRAGLDYREWVEVRTYPSLDACLERLTPARLWALSTRGQRAYRTIRFGLGDAFLFGPETRGLPDEVLRALPCGQLLHLPMRRHNRSLNLSNAVAVVLFEAWAQLDFVGAATRP